MKEGKQLNIVAVTACQAGIAHTYLCAQALEDAAKELGHKIKIETMGSIGVENELTEEEIAKADFVILAVEINISRSRFRGKAIYDGSGNHAIAVDGLEELKKAIKWFEEDYVPSENDEADDYDVNSSAAAVSAKTKASNDGTKEKYRVAKDLYKHFMAGISHIIPFIVAGGMIQALSIALTNTNSMPQLAEVLGMIGGNAFGMMTPIMAMFMASSIADRPGYVPGMVAGLIATQTGSGFVGAIFGGFIAGYFTLFLKKNLKLKGALQSMMPILILPLISSLVTGLSMIYIVDAPLTYINNAISAWLQGLADGGASAILLGALLGWMITGDFGGILCRVSYAFGIASLAAGPSVAMASTMAGGLITGLSLTFATLLWPRKFTDAERDLGKTTWIMGMSFIVESGIPFAARDPKVQFLAHGLGGAITGAIVAAFGCTQSVVHGGMWVLLIPGTITNVPGYLIAVAIGTAFATLYMGIFKKNLA